MATKYSAGELVYVPSVKLSDPGNEPFALVRRQVLRQGDGGRSVVVADREHETEVATRFVQPPHLGVALVQVGDLQSDRTLLEPLAKSVLQYLRLLLDDDSVKHVRVRTLLELTKWWALEGASVTHCVLVGHGPNGLAFLDRDETLSGEELGAALAEVSPARDRKTFVSLACQTGRERFGQRLSRTDVCDKFIGPMQSVHGASASQYLQTLLAHHLLEGVGLLAAHRRARKASTTSTGFRFYNNGELVTDAPL